MTTLTETVGEGELSFTLTWQLDPKGTTYVHVLKAPNSPYAQASIFQDGTLDVSQTGDFPFSFSSPNDVKLHLALLKWIYIRGRELTKNPNMEAW